MALSGEERELWIRYRRDGDAAARDYLFETYAPWARRVAGGVYARLRVSQMEWADFVQNASIGLLEAMSRFDPDKGIDFTSYAKLRVQGATFNGVRIFLTGVDRAGSTARFDDRLQHTSQDFAEDFDPLTAMIDAVAGLGLGFLLESSTPAGAEDLQLHVEQQQLNVRLTNALEQLGDQERTVLMAHYLNHVPFSEIAARMGLTKGRISQIHSAGLKRVRSQLLADRFDKEAYF